MTSDNIKSSPYLRSFLNYGLSAILAIIFLYIAFYNVDFGEVLRLVSGASIFWMAAFISSFFFGHVIRTLRWKVILNSVKPHVSFKHLFGALMVGYGVNCVTPKLGEISRAVLLGRWENLSRSSMLGTIIVERVIDIVALGIAVIISAYIWSENLYDKLPWLESTLYAAGTVMFVIILMIFLTIIYKEKFFGIIIRLFSKISEKFAHKLAYIFGMLTEGFSSLKGTRNYIYTILLTIILMMVYALSSYLGFFMLDIKPVTYEMGWIVMSIAAIGVVIPTPGSTGSYHTLAKSTLVLLFGFGENISAAYAFLTHIISYFLFIFVALFIYFVFNKNKNNLIQPIDKKQDNI